MRVPPGPRRLRCLKHRKIAEHANFNWPRRLVA